MTLTPAQHPTDAPFWMGHPDVATFEQQHADRLARARAAIVRLEGVAGPRTLANTLVPYDEAVIELDSAGSQASLIENVHPDASLRAAAEQVSQKAAALGTELSLNRGVYEALAALDVSRADPETRHYVQRTLRDFRLAGVDRDAATRARIAKLHEELVEIGQQFSRNIRSDRRSITVKDAAELDGLPEDFIARHAPGPDGTLQITTDYPDAVPVFTYAKSDTLRHQLHLALHNRAWPVNVEVLDALLAKRHELATLIGFTHWADYVTADKMVGSASSASTFIDRIVGLSGERGEEEFAALLERKRRDAPAAETIQAWESAYWAEQVRRDEYDFDAQTVRPYFPFARVKQGALDVASRLFGVTFERVDAPVWHRSVECWQVREGPRLVGRFYLDMHPRPDKFSHAAEFDVRTGVAGRQIPEAALVCNFPGGDAGDPGLMEHTDVRTMFHEFGHLLHALFGGRHRWAGIGGIRAEHDFIEVPSQLFEEWIWEPEVLATFARHYRTDEPIPADTVRRMTRASEFGKGLAVRRQMVYARISLSAFDRDPAGLDFDALVERVQTDYQPFPFVPGTHTQCSFGHLEGYSAGYYTYMWSLVISKDFFSRFRGASLLDPRVALEYRKKVLEAGGSKPAADIVRDFLGRDFEFDAYREWLGKR
jgi:Zn-dependent oligopeptidase